jgi:hypothetical protein
VRVTNKPGGHSHTNIPDTLDTLKFGVPPGTDLQMTHLHFILLSLFHSHLDKKNTYVRMLFIGYSSAFNTMVPFKLNQ